MTPGEVSDMVDELEPFDDRLSTWETEFVADMALKAEAGTHLTQNEGMRLSEIWRHWTKNRGTS